MEVLNKGLLKCIEEGSRKFLSLIEGKEERIRVISHNDTDGITSAAIMAKILKRLNVQYWLSNIKSFDSKTLENLGKDEWDIAFILDFGLNREKLEKLDNLGKKIFVIDHHIIDSNLNLNNITIISAYHFKEEIATAGLAYFFGKEISEKNKDLAHIAIIGLIGDLQKINEGILKDALFSKKVTVRKSIKVFGTSTKPLHKALAYSDIFLPNVSGNEKEAIEIIKQAGIKLIENKSYRTLLDLSEEEMKRLCTMIAARTGNQDFTEDCYLINSNGKLYDGKELSTMINSCGRLGKPEIGIEACYGNLKGAEKVYRAYKKELVSALKWFKKNRESNKNEETQAVIESCGGKVWLINARSEIKDTIIGVLTSMLSRHYKEKVLVGMAESEDLIKISARSSEINVKEFLDEMLKDIAVEVGGHKAAAGGLIEKENGKVFISRIKGLAKW